MINRYSPTYSLINLARASVVQGLEPYLPGLPSATSQVWTDTGTDALLLALKSAVPLGPVAVTAYTCNKVPVALLAAGYTPCFFDISLETGLAPAEYLAVFTPGSIVAIIATHMFGAPCDMVGYKKHAERLGVPLIEDCAGGFGSSIAGRPTGSSGDFAVFSFGRGKALNLSGGGLLIANSHKSFDLIRQYIESNKLQILKPSCFKRLTKFGTQAVTSSCCWGLLFQSALLLKYWREGTWLWEQNNPPGFITINGSISLQFAESFRRLVNQIDVATHLEHLQALTQTYQSSIIETAVVHTLSPPDYADRIARPGFPLRCKSRGSILKRLRRLGVDCGVSFSYSAGTLHGGDYPGSQRLASEILTLPAHAEVSIREAERISELVNSLQEPSSNGI